MIKNIVQPNIIVITENLRLKKYDGTYDFALKWYQDRETLLLVNGNEKIYDLKQLKAMYEYLAENGEEYIIEYKEKDMFVPIGDVTLMEEDCPIVIGDKRYRGKGIGKQVIMTMVNRAKELGFPCMKVDEIYSYNIASRKIFEACEFEKYKDAEKGSRYIKKLK